MSEDDIGYFIHLVAEGVDYAFHRGLKEGYLSDVETYVGCSGGFQSPGGREMIRRAKEVVPPKYWDADMEEVWACHVALLMGMDEDPIGALDVAARVIRWEELTLETFAKLPEPDLLMLKNLGHPSVAEHQFEHNEPQIIHWEGTPYEVVHESPCRLRDRGLTCNCHPTFTQLETSSSTRGDG